MTGRSSSLGILFCCALIASSSVAYEGLDLYDCVISDQDRVNSSGTKLTSVRDILAQDRANYHKFHRRDALDSGDGHFTSPARRATWKTAQIRVSPILAQRIKNGGNVEIKVFVLTEDSIEVRSGLLTFVP